MPSAKREKLRKEKLPAPENGEGTNPTVGRASALPTATSYGDDYQRLLIALCQAPSGALLFIQLNSPVHRRLLPQQLAADGLQRSFAVADFTQLPAGPPPYGILREFVEELHPKPEVLFVDGLEHRIETQPNTILDLNLGRERLANLRVVVVFLLPAYVIDLIRAHALNLWSWRAHHYILEPPDDFPRHDGALVSLTTDHAIAPGDTPEARERRIRILRRFLDEGLAENRSLESLLHPVLMPLARDLRDTGRFADALAVLDHLQSVITSGTDSPDTAEVLNLQAIALTSLGAFDKAEPLYHRALAIREKVLGPDHPDTAQSLNNLARFYDGQGLYAQAEPLYHRALAIREKVLGPDHLATATILNNLAVLYHHQGLYAQAEPLYHRALAITEKVLGLEHPATATILNNLAGLYKNQGLYAQAEPLYHRALAILEKTLLDHPNTAKVLESYAALLRATQREADAATLEARAIREKQEHET